MLAAQNGHLDTVKVLFEKEGGGQVGPVRNLKNNVSAPRH